MSLQKRLDQAAKDIRLQLARAGGSPISQSSDYFERLAEMLDEAADDEHEAADGFDDLHDDMCELEDDVERLANWLREIARLSHKGRSAALKEINRAALAALNGEMMRVAGEQRGSTHA